MKLASGNRWHLHLTLLTEWALPLYVAHEFGTVVIQLGPVQLGLDITNDV